MYLNIQISDAVYQALLAGQGRIQGTIGLVNPTEGNFNAHHRHKYVRPEMKFIQLPHGRASITEERVSLSLRIDRRECNVLPHQVIDVESQEACDFVYTQTLPRPLP